MEHDPFGGSGLNFLLVRPIICWAHILWASHIARHPRQTIYILESFALNFKSQLVACKTQPNYLDLQTLNRTMDQTWA